MELTLGIDTGGTFTDSVIFELQKQRVLAKAKANTTYEDLSVGIRNSIDGLNFADLSAVKVVALSTTLATNAIVEGRGREVGLILIGEEPIGPLPVQHYALLRGGHDLKGNQKEELDESQLEQVLAGFAGQVEAIAISGFASVRNPEHELRVKALVEQRLQLPVVCGHQLTTALGFKERTVTAVLNARLIPILANLIASVKQVLSEKGIEAALMVVKGDGALMGEAVALEKPIETILSGPAASIIGATTLTEKEDALVLDMGGTTADVAVLKGGLPRLNREGATVGGWLTRVQAIDIYTYGLGGDSYLRLNKQNNPVLGPQKVWPLAYVGSRYPSLLMELEEQYEQRHKLKPTDGADAYVVIKKENPSFLTEVERAAMDLLAIAPHSVYQLATALKVNPFSFDLDRLLKLGMVAKAAITPTDLLHVQGTFCQWNADISRVGMKILADNSGRTLERFVTEAYELVIHNLCTAILQSSLGFEGTPTDYLNYLLRPQAEGIIETVTKLKLPIVGLGAPVAAYLPEVARRLNSELLIPLHADVANAVGAAAGKVVEKVELSITASSEGYIMYSQWERKSFSELEVAKAYALAQAVEQAQLLANKSGVSDSEIATKCEDRYIADGLGPYLETRIEAIAFGRPAFR